MQNKEQAEATAEVVYKGLEIFRGYVNVTSGEIYCEESIEAVEAVECPECHDRFVVDDHNDFVSHWLEVHTDHFITS